MHRFARSFLRGELKTITSGHRLGQGYLAIVLAPARTNTWLASDHKIFFGVVHKAPDEVHTSDVFAFLNAQRSPRHDEEVVHAEDGNAGLAGRTTAHRLLSMRDPYSYLCVQENCAVSHNRVPMNLTAITTLLGHRSMRISMLHTHITNRTVADEHFSVTEKVAALHDAPCNRRAEMHRQLPGYGSQGAGLNRQFKSIYESCTFFQASIEFSPTLERERDNAASKGQVERHQVFDVLLARAEKSTS